METTTSNFAARLANFLPKRDKIYDYHFITETTRLVKGKKEWQKTERQVEISYMGKKEDFRFYQILTPKIIFTSNKGFPNQMVLKQMGYVFDCIEIGVNNKGFIKTVFNIDHLKMRMQEIKNHLEKDHAGESFVNLFSGMATTLQEEKKIIQFLQSYKMFGLYFNGLCQQYQVDTPNSIIRKKVLDDFDQVEIEKEIIVTENNNNYTYTVNKKSEDERIEKYNGIYIAEYNQLISGSIIIEKGNTNIKYSTSWVR